MAAKSTWIAACALVFATAAIQCGPQAAPEKQAARSGPAPLGKKGGSMATVPLELRLIATPGPGLRAELANLSPIPQPYLHESFHQPCGLTLKRADGKVVSGFDSRRIKKQSNALEEDMYATVEPGKADTLLDESFVDSEGAYELHWGPYRFQGLPPGKYRAMATWKSAKDPWSEAESGKTGRMLWKGTLKSREVEFELPPLP